MTPEIRLTAVVLPAPLGPMMPRISPSPTSKLRFATASQAAEILAESSVNGEDAGHVRGAPATVGLVSRSARSAAAELDQAARQEGHGGEQDGAEHDLLQVDVAAQAARAASP